MQFKTIALSLFVAAASAQSIAQLISELPACAAPCIAKASESIGCAATDIACQCKKADELTAAGTQCVATACTSTSDLTATLDISTKVCAAVAAGSPLPSMSSAANTATAAPSGSASGSATSTPTSSASVHASGTATPSAVPTAGAFRNGAALGLAAAAVAMAL